MPAGNICKSAIYLILFVGIPTNVNSWLNEGWTTYLERRLQAGVHGEPHRDFSAIIGWKALGKYSQVL